MKTSSKYPLGKFILQHLDLKEISLADLAMRIGYKNLNKGVRSLDFLLENGAADVHLIDKLATYFRTEKRTFRKVLSDTLLMLQLEGERQAELEETIERLRFQPHLVAFPKDERPSQICFHILLDCDERSKVYLPDNYFSLSKNERLNVVQKAIRDHYAKSNGRSLFRGSYEFYRLWESYDDWASDFTPDGVLIGAAESSELPDEPIIWLGKRQFNGRFYPEDGDE